MADELTRSRQSFEARAWNDAFLELSRADAANPLGAGDLELLAMAAYLTGRDLEFQKLSERAHHAHLAASSAEGAARCAFWLGLTLALRGEAGQAGGWLARARRFVEGRDSVQHGYLLLPAAEEHLAGGDADAAYSSAAAAAEIGDRFRDDDLLACARHLQGRALIRRGAVHEGLALLDEAMLGVVAGELSPIVTGLVYCSVIDACRQIHAVSRAREWTSALTRWCEGQPEMVAFTGTCLVHRAEIMQLNGAWADAMAETRRACESASERTPPAAAFYQRAEIHRLRGEFDAAEEAYRNASRLGCEPQPGLALLRAAQGRTDAACAAIRRVTDATSDPLRRAKLLPASVEIMLLAGDVESASSACRSLEEIAAAFDTDVLGAMAASARGAVDLAGGDAAAALRALERAFDIWQRIEAPYEAARVRVRIGSACRALGDDEAAELALAAARGVFERLEAAPDLARLDALARDVAGENRHGLTRRELEVLRLVAAGKTNRAIAAELCLSERTIDRHVSKILTKLQVASRAAATAWAFSNELV